MTTVLDEFDRRILSIVQRDCLVTTDAIAERIGLSTSAVQKRLKRMRTEQVITTESSVVHRDAGAPPTPVIAAMAEARENEEPLAKFRECAKYADWLQPV